MIISLASLMISAVLLAGCGDTCADNKNALPRAAFYAGEATVSVDSLEIRGIGAPGDSILSEGTERKSEIYLPFRIDSDSTVYSFDYTGGVKASSIVTFIYSRTPRFVSAECGVSYVFDIRKIECKGNLIDSVTCPQGFIDNAPGVNLRIYLRTTPEEP